MYVFNDEIELKEKELNSIFATREILKNFKCRRTCVDCIFKSENDNYCNLTYAWDILDDIVRGVFND